MTQSVFLVFGAEGCRKERLIQELVDRKNNSGSEQYGTDVLKKYCFVGTVVSAPADITFDMKSTPDRFDVVDHEEFLDRFTRKEFDLCWREFLDKQYNFSATEEMDKNYTFRAIPRLDKIFDKNPECSRFVISLSNSTCAEENNFNALLSAIELYRAKYNVKIILVRTTAKIVGEELNKKACYNKDEIETLLVHHRYLEKDKTVNSLRRYLHDHDNLPLSFVDMTNNMDADSRRMINEMEGKTLEENEPYFETKQIARQYMKKHNISELLQYLLQLVLIETPTNPRQFLIEELEKLKSKKSTSILTTTDFETMFSIIDINNKGFVSYEQTLNSLVNLAIAEQTAKEALKSFDVNSRITKDQFVKIMSAHLNILNGTSYQ